MSLFLSVVQPKIYNVQLVLHNQGEHCDLHYPEGPPMERNKTSRSVYTLARIPILQPCMATTLIGNCEILGLLGLSAKMLNKQHAV